MVTLSCLRRVLIIVAVLVGVEQFLLTHQWISRTNDELTIETTAGNNEPTRPKANLQEHQLDTTPLPSRDSTEQDYYTKPAFPLPLPTPEARFAIAPEFGQHRRSHQHVIFSFARGLSLEKLLPFLNTLWETGYDGDIVLGVAPDLTTEMKSYFQHYSEQLMQ